MTYQDTLHAIAENPHTWASDDKAAIYQACDIALAEHGRITISEVRPILKRIREVHPNRIGANIRGYATTHKLNFAGYETNGDNQSGNRNKPATIWRKA